MTTRETDVPRGVVTFVLTDVEGSTDLWESHQDDMAKVMLRHYEIAAEIAEAHGGRMPRSQGEGDSTLTAYARASDAINAILEFERAIQLEAWPDDIQLCVRAGLHTGEAEVEHGEYFGATLSRAARVRALARGGQVLLSQATAELVADRLPPDVTLQDLGRVRLKGLERAEEVYQLCAPHLPEVVPTEAFLRATETPQRLPFPSTLHPDESRFVDRGDEMSAVRRRWTGGVQDQHRHLVLVSGDPGIGKTRFVSELARALYDDAGATVLHGRCYEENLVTYQPFVELLEHVVRNGAPEDVRGHREERHAAHAPRARHRVAFPRSSRPGTRRTGNGALPHVRGGEHDAFRAREAITVARGARRPALGRPTDDCVADASDARSSSRTDAPGRDLPLARSRR